MTLIDTFTHHSGLGFLSLGLRPSVFFFGDSYWPWTPSSCSWNVGQWVHWLLQSKDGTVKAPGWACQLRVPKSLSPRVPWVETRWPLLAGVEFERVECEAEKASWKRGREGALTACGPKLCRVRRRWERVFSKKRQRTGAKVNPLFSLVLPGYGKTKLLPQNFLFKFMLRSSMIIPEGQMLPPHRPCRVTTVTCLCHMLLVILMTV